MWLYVKAQARFHRRRYEDAARLFNKMLRFETGDDRKEVTLGYLGRAYFQLGRLQEASAVMAEAFELYLKRGPKLYSEHYYRAVFAEFKGEYVRMLHAMGMDKRAEAVESAYAGLIANQHGEDIR